MSRSVWVAYTRQRYPDIVGETCVFFAKFGILHVSSVFFSQDIERVLHRHDICALMLSLLHGSVRRSNSGEISGKFIRKSGEYVQFDCFPLCPRGLKLLSFADRPLSSVLNFNPCPALSLHVSHGGTHNYRGTLTAVKWTPYPGGRPRKFGGFAMCWNCSLRQSRNRQNVARRPLKKNTMLHWSTYRQSVITATTKQYRLCRTEA